jgi:protein SCO1/2
MGKIILNLILLALQQIVLAQDSLFPVEARYIYKDINDAEIITSNNQTITLSELWNKKPLLLTLVFSRCIGICSPLIKSLDESIKKLGEDKKSEFYIVVLSFDPYDSPQKMKLFGDNLNLTTKNNWIFGIYADTSLIESFTKSFGFWYKWVDSVEQFDHPGMVVGIRNGKIVRILVGGNITAVKLRELINEIKGEFVPFYSLNKNVAFRCLNYDPETGKVKVGTGILIMFMPAVLTFFITLFIFGSPNKNKIRC